MKKTGIFAWYGYFTDYRKRLERIKDAGFDGIMLWWEDEGGDWPIPRREMERLALQWELTIFNFHMAAVNDNDIWNCSISVREGYLKPICKTMEEMADLGYHNLVMHLCERGDVPDPDVGLLHSIEYLLPYAEDNRITLSLENTWRADYLEYVWSAFPGVKELGFCFDTSHANLKDQFYLLQKYQHLLTALHLSDNDGTGDQHRLPFDGTINFAQKVTPYLIDSNLPYTMELIADQSRYPDERTFLKTAFERVTRLLELEEERIQEEKKNDQMFLRF
ncbi:MAG TPA: TIM barrel protein [Clostridiales bacterium]|nr:TIM barrel protein [Clostridiales bacterium]